MQLKLNNKLIIVFISLFASGIFTVVFMGSHHSRENMEVLIESSAHSQVKANVQLINTKLETLADQLKAIAATGEIQSMQWEQQNQFLQQLVLELNRNFSVTDLGGNLRSTRGENTTVREQLFFQKARAGEVFVSDPVGEGANKRLIIAVPIMKDTAVQGVLSTEIPVSFLADLMREMQLAQDGYGYIINKEGLLVAHPNEDWILTRNLITDFDGQTKEAAEQILSKRQGIARYTLDGQDAYVSFAPIPNLDWFLVMRAPERLITEAIVQQRKYSLLLGLATLILGAFLVYYLSLKITSPLEKLTEMAGSLASGNIAIQAQVKSSDELGTLASAFNEMASFLKGMLSELAEVTGALVDTSKQVAGASASAGAAIEDVAQGANEFAAAAQQMDASVDSISNTAQSVSQKAGYGSKAIDQVQKQMNTIVASTDQVAEAMAALSTRSQKVGEIVTAISKIAEQTNLLALNAAIEAARAGEHGRGFTVVAEQIRALAESTQKETIQIPQLIAGIQKEIQKATESIAQEVREVKKGSNVIDRAQTVFSEIIESIQKLAADMTFIADSSRQIANSSQQIAAATEEQTASVEEIAASADELRSLAEKLSQLSSRFKLE